MLRDYKTNREWLYIQSNKLLMLDDLLFTSYRGQSLNPSVVSHNFHKIALQANLPGVRFHDLRHTFASLMLLRGVSPEIISKALGHSSVSFTMDIYSHIIDGMQSDAVKLLDDLLPKGISQSNNYNLTTLLKI